MTTNTAAIQEFFSANAEDWAECQSDIMESAIAKFGIAAIESAAIELIGSKSIPDWVEHIPQSQVLDNAWDKAYPQTPVVKSDDTTTIANRFGSIKAGETTLTLDCPKDSIKWVQTLALTGSINWQKTAQHLTRPQGWKLSFVADVDTTGGQDSAILYAEKDGVVAQVDIYAILRKFYAKGDYYPLAKVGEEKNSELFKAVELALNSAINDALADKASDIKKAAKRDSYAETCKAACEKAGYTVKQSARGDYYIPGNFAYMQGRKTRYMPDPDPVWLAENKGLLALPSGKPKPKIR